MVVTSGQPFSKGHGTQLLFLQLPPEALAPASAAATTDVTTGVDFSQSSKPRRDGGCNLNVYLISALGILGAVSVSA